MTVKRKLDTGTARLLAQFLGSRRNELTDRIRGLMHSTAVTEARVSPDHTDRARASLEAEIGAVQLDRLSRQLVETEAALERLGRRQYGWCADCGNSIGLDRLKALPFARRCRTCQNAIESDAFRPRPAVDVSPVIYSSAAREVAGGAVE